MRRAPRALLALLLPLLLVSGTAPAHAATLRRGVSLWLPWWSMQAANTSTLDNASVIRTASPFWYAIAKDSTVVAHSGAGNATLVAGWHAKHLAVIPTVTESEDGHDFGLMGTTRSRRIAHVNALSRIVRAGRYDGLDLDYEDLALFRVHNDTDADRAGQALTDVVQAACTMLHSLGKKCVVTVMARTDDSHTYFRNILATWVYDYRALGKVADTVRIMAYGEHGPSGPAGPIASIGWVKQVVAYAQQTLTLSRTELGLPAYGQDWSSAGNLGVTSRQAVANAAAYKATIRYDATAHECTYSYHAKGVLHTVWFGDTRSIDERTALAVQDRFAGVALWAAGGEQASVWPKLRARFTS